MRDKILFTYVLLCILLLSIIGVSVYYINYLHKDLYSNYLQEKIVYPEYDLETNQLSNASDVTVKNVSDFVPAEGLVLYNIYRFGLSWGMLIHAIMILLLVPVFLICRKQLSLIKVSIITASLASTFFLLQILIV